MKRTERKSRTVILTVLSVVALLLGSARHANRAFSAGSPGTMYVTNACSASVTAYPADASGDVAPLPPPQTGLAIPHSIALDANGRIYVANECAGGNAAAVVIFSMGADGNEAPLATIGGSNTGLELATAVALDSAGNIYVSGVLASGPGVAVFSPLGTSTGFLNEAPIATISGNNTGLEEALNLVLDASNDIYVVDDLQNSVSLFSPLGSNRGNLNPLPLATLRGTSTGLNMPMGMALDGNQNVYITQSAEVIIYAPIFNKTGVVNQAPLATITGDQTGLSLARGITLDSNGRIFVADGSAISIFPPLGSSTGTLDETPLATITGTDTDLGLAADVRLDSNNKIIVADDFRSSVFVYPALGAGTGTLNEAPSTLISTTATTGLGETEGVAVDSNGKIYVATFEGFPNVLPGASISGSVNIYPAGSNANSAPLAEINGASTGLTFPVGVALDSQNKIYVADASAQVLVYPALGSNSGLLNQAPTATIKGSNTGFSEPQGIALDSSGKIYVTDVETTSVAVFSALGNQTGVINQSPLATIGGSNTGLAEPQGIAIDSHGNIFVADLSLEVFPPLGVSTGNLNEAPIGTIGGLVAPAGVAIDPDDNIYVTDLSSSVYVFPPFTGASENIPITTLSGLQTGLNEPEFIAVQGAFGPTPTPTRTPAPTRTPTPSPTPTPFRTQTPTRTPTPVPTATRTPTPTPTVVCPLFDANEVGSAAAKPPKLPKLKPIKFPTQTVGTTSAPAMLEVPATNGLTVTGVSSTGDFIATDTCVGQPLPCSISITYLPSKIGASRGTLSIANNLKTLTVALSGSGAGPKVKSLSERSLPPLSMLTLNGLGFDPDRSTSVLVSFSEKIAKTKQSVVLIVPASSKTGSAVQVQVPPIFDPATKQLIPGSATLGVQEMLKSGQTLSSKSPALKISQLNSSNQLPGGAATLQFLMAEKNFATQLEQDVKHDPFLSGIEDSLMNAESALSGLITLLSGNPNANLGTIGATQIIESSESLVAADNQILQMLATMAGNSASSAGTGATAGGNGCLAAEAQAAINDSNAGNVAGFANDLTQLFADSETSTSCQQPTPAIATLGIVNGAGGVALAIIAQANSTAIQPILPTAALLLADLGPAGQLLSVGTSLAQTSTQSRQMVQSAVASFNLASSAQLSAVAGQTQGPLSTSFSSTGQTETSFNAETPPPLDGTYAGSFTGTEFATGACPAPISGSIGFKVSGASIAATIPGSGSGTLDPNTGIASFAPSGLGANVTCSFAGTLLQNPTASATGSGTWSCTSTGIGSTFNSANGTWSATMQ